MAVPDSTRRQLDYHLSQAEFALRVAVNFSCLASSPAHDGVRAALAQVAAAREWVQTRLEVEKLKLKPAPPKIGQGLPLTRAERLHHRWT